MRSGLAPRADCPPGVTEKENELEGPVFVRTDKWHAEYMQINMQIDTNFLRAAQAPMAYQYQHTHSNS